MSKNMAQEWQRSALADLKNIEHIIKDDFLTHIVAFHSQQCVEKSFKSILEYGNKTVPKKHDLVILHNLIQSILTIENEDILDTLNSLYIDSRYPGDLGLLPNGKPTLADAEEFYEFAKEVYDKVKNIIENQTETI